jgi:hypothetical protein
MDVILALESLYLLKNRIKIRCVVLLVNIEACIGADSGTPLCYTMLL